MSTTGDLVIRFTRCENCGNPLEYCKCEPVPDYNPNGTANPIGDASYWRARAERAEATVALQMDAMQARIAELIEQANSAYEPYRAQIAALTEQVAALQARAAELEAVQRWIPVEERLPEPGVPVLMWLHPRHIPGQAKEGTYMPVLNPDRPWRSTWDMSTYETGEITLWRPMPSVPNVEDE